MKRTEVSPAAEDRSQQLEQLVQRNFASIIDAVNSAGLLVSDTERLTDAIAKYLPAYTGPIEDGPFQQWILDTVVPAADRMSAFLAFQERHEGIVRKGIWDVLKTCLDLGVNLGTIDETGRKLTPTVDEIGTDVWKWALDNFDSLMQPDHPAKPSTRLYERAYWAGRRWKTDRLRQRDREVTDPDQIDRITSSTGRTGTRTGYVPHVETPRPPLPDKRQTKAQVVTESRRCSGCNAVLGRWNTKATTCFACWEAGK